MHIKMASCYIQEKGAIHQIGTHFKYLMYSGVLVIMDEFSFSNLKEAVSESVRREGISYKIECLQGECCKTNIDNLVKIVQDYQMDCVIGVGGGKVLDVAKAVGHYGRVKTVVVPTAASTDGPCSKISVLYKEDGTFKEYLYLNHNPDGVLVDTETIAHAPVRLLKAGIGDALSTYFETEAGYKGDIERTGSSDISQMARIVSRRCFDIIMDKGTQAIESVEKNEVNEALEQVVEAIIYLSCIGFENGSLGAAHAICNALSSQSDYNHLLHGEKVAFGTMVQMVLEMQPWEMIAKVRDFCKEIGLPYSANTIGLEEVAKVVERCCQKDQPIYRMRSIFINEEAVKSAIMFTRNL